MKQKRKGQRGGRGKKVKEKKEAGVKKRGRMGGKETLGRRRSRKELNGS